MNIASFKNKHKELLYISFSKNGSEFYTGTNSGYSRYNTSPFQHTTSSKIGGVGFVAGLKNNIIALVGGGNKPACISNSQLQIYKHQDEWIYEITCPSEILNIEVTRNGRFLGVVTEKLVLVYETKEYRQILKLPTVENTKGLFNMIYKESKKTLILVIPGEKKGRIEVHTFRRKDKKNEHMKNEIIAHESEISYMTLNYDGSLIATASKRGTIIRVFSLEKEDFSKKKHEFRRGSYIADIYCLSFSPRGKYIASTSSTGTLHIFSLVEAPKKGILSYVVSNNRSIIQFLMNEQVDIPNICCWIDSSTVGLLNTKGKFLTVEMDLLKEKKIVIQKKTHHLFKTDVE